MPQVPFSEENIIHILQSDDRLQQDTVVKYLWKKYLGWVKKRVNIYRGGLDDVTEEVLHETIVAFVLNVREGKYDPTKSAMGTYFCGIAKNILLKILRERNAGRIISLNQLPPDFSRITTNEIEKSIGSAEINKKMKSAIEQLDVNCQQVLMQFYHEGKSIREIAEVLGKDEITVRQWRHRCTEKLRKILGDNFKNWYYDI